MTSFVKKSLASLAIGFMALALFAPLCQADAKDHLVKELMDRIQTASSNYDQVSYRVKDMDKEDPRSKAAEPLLAKAAKARDDLKALDPSGQVEGSGDDVRPSQNFLDREKDFNDALNAVNRTLVAAVEPGAKKPGTSGTVPKGTLTEDFLPQVIKVMFQFASLAVLVGLITAGVMLVIVYDKEEYVTKAKRILFFSLVGFAFVALAYAIVRAITNINFFGVI